MTIDEINEFYNEKQRELALYFDEEIKKIDKKLITYEKEKLIKKYKKAFISLVDNSLYLYTENMKRCYEYRKSHRFEEDMISFFEKEAKDIFDSMISMGKEILRRVMVYVSR